MGDQGHPDHLAGQPEGFLGGLGDFDPAALATAAGMNLGLEDDRAAELDGDILGRLGGLCDFPARNGHSIQLQDLLGLVFMDFHDE
jgi:hypothetical protein